MSRKLLKRDPRNQEHFLEAMAVVMAYAEIAIHPHVQDDLRKVGLVMTDDVPIKKIELDDLVMCVPYLLDQPLTLPDNIIASCADCRSAIQVRPQAMAVRYKLCVFCTADRVLTEGKD